MKPKFKFKNLIIEPYESFYWNTTENFFRGQLGGIARSVKCDDSLAVIVEVKDESKTNTTKHR